MVDEYIGKQQDPQQEICKELRRIIFDTFPGIKEEIKWGVPVYGGGIYYIVALKDHVNLGFTLQGLTEDDYRSFDGTGKTMRHLAISSLKDIDERKIIDLLKLVEERQKIKNNVITAKFTINIAKIRSKS